MTPLVHYGALWRTHRKLWHQHFGSREMGRYNALVEMEARTLCTRLLENDRNVCNQLKLLVSHPGHISYYLLINLVQMDCEEFGWGSFWH